MFARLRRSLSACELENYVDAAQRVRAVRPKKNTTGPPGVSTKRRAGESSLPARPTWSMRRGSWAQPSCLLARASKDDRKKVSFERLGMLASLRAKCSVGKRSEANMPSPFEGARGANERSLAFQTRPTAAPKHRGRHGCVLTNPRKGPGTQAQPSHLSARWQAKCFAPRTSLKKKRVSPGSHRKTNPRVTKMDKCFQGFAPIQKVFDQRKWNRIRAVIANNSLVV